MHSNPPPFHVVIPARLHATRLPRKLLQLINNQSVLERTYRQVLLANPKTVTIAVDHEDIAIHAQDFGAQVLMTSPKHPSGTDRIAQVVSQSQWSPEDIVVNVQADEPFIPPELIRQVAQVLHETKAPMATLCWPITSLEELNNPNVVKVVRNAAHQALYFSRAPIPRCRDDSTQVSQQAYKHIGLYAYRAAFLLDLVALPVCDLEQFEALEQLRVLYAGIPIQVEQACVAPLQDINTQEDLDKACVMAPPTHPPQHVILS